MTIIEIAVYAAVLSGAQPMLCGLYDDAVVARCSNGLTAVIVGSSTVAYGNGVVVRHKRDEFPVFDDGLQSWFNSAHWLEFSNGTSVRRRSTGDYEFGNGLVCRLEMPSLANCAAQRGK
jgi:hypothetical protein